MPDTGRQASSSKERHAIVCSTQATSHSFNKHTMARRRRPPRPGALADLSPSRILKQMALLQFFYYGVAIVLIVFTTFVAGRHPDAKEIMGWRELRGDVTTGWTLALCWLLGSLITYVSLSHFNCKSAAANTRLLKCHPNPPFNRAIETRARFRFDNPFHPPGRHLSLFTRHTKHTILVVRSSRFCHLDGLSRNVGLSMARVAAHGIWWKSKSTCKGSE